MALLVLALMYLPWWVWLIVFVLICVSILKR